MGRRRGATLDIVRRVQGRDVVFTGHARCYWLDLDEGYRVFFHRNAGRWVVTRAGSPAVLSQGRSLTEAYARVRSHYLAMRRLAG
ncbi:hypothetical protein [Falsiroseomonas sp. HW251]|uniref:hypothetical protein n=1 Tax=Falsiroseomonas sp. HW251 TaxID=3390998 RepID=UPI003D31655E